MTTLKERVLLPGALCVGKAQRNGKIWVAGGYFNDVVGFNTLEFNGSDVRSPVIVLQKVASGGSGTRTGRNVVYAIVCELGLRYTFLSELEPMNAERG